MGQIGFKNQSPSHAADLSPLIYWSEHPQGAFWVSSVSCSSKLWTLSCWLWEMFHAGQQEVVKLGSLLNCDIIKDAPETAVKLNLKMGPESQFSQFPLSRLGGRSARASPTRPTSAHGATLAATASSSPWRWWTRVWVAPFNTDYRVIGPLRLQLSPARRPYQMPMCVPGRDPHNWVQPGGGQVLWPYWSWQGEAFLQMMIQWACLSAKLVFHCPVRRIWRERVSATAASALCVKTTESMNELSGYAVAVQ